MDMQIFYADCYNRPEKITQHLKSYLLNLIISGLDYMYFTNSAHESVNPPFPLQNGEPCLFLVPPGTTLKFSMNAKRENWAILMNSAEISSDIKTFQSFIGQASLNPFLRPPLKKVYELRELFSAISANVASGQPAGMEKAKLLTSAILAELIPDLTEQPVKSRKALLMKQAIDQDLHFEHSISELNAQLGFCSLAYMRKLFYEEYGILPGDYRNNQRMNRILELFARTDLSLKMIANEVGMKHVTHLYAFLESRQHVSPKELLLQFRGK